jgi:hypothetical protein
VGIIANEPGVVKQIHGIFEQDWAVTEAGKKAARKAANSLDYGEKKVSLSLNLEQQPIGMPRQLGFERGQSIVTLTVALDLDEKISARPL